MHMKPPSPEDVLSTTPQKPGDKLAEVIDGMTEKQKKFAIERISNPDGTVIEAAKRAGYSLTKSAKASKIATMNEAHVRKLLSASGLSLRKLLKLLKEETEATQLLVKVVKLKGPEGESYEKTITREVPIHAIRIKAIEMALRLHGAFAAMKINVKNDTDHNFNLNGVPLDQLLQMRNERRKVIDTEVQNVAS